MTEKLPSLIIVIAVAKRGKSTALNFILHSISYDGIADTEQVEEIFEREILWVQQSVEYGSQTCKSMVETTDGKV